ncbi:hypothetical protein chiPu_0014383 [Chiloscyllium punctatum]|uniref:Uncharacterized protein n=1 Tax=Chiloscyllium punctatum TaxID=137246 RepID=A0A401SZS2_CHIPU|nr:hypothetical protein [Chiloscyllium punctatum]
MGWQQHGSAGVVSTDIMLASSREAGAVSVYSVSMEECPVTGLISKSFRSNGECERDGRIVMNNAPSSNSKHEMLKAKETPLCSGRDRVNTNLLYDGMKQCTQMKGGWVLRETLKVNNSLDSDSGDARGKEQGLMRKTFRNKLCPRAQNTEGSSQASAGNHDKTAWELLKQEGDWRKESSGTDQESGDSNDSGRDRRRRKKLRKKKVRRWQARKDAEVEKFSDPVNGDIRKKTQAKKRRQKINYLEDGDKATVTPNGAAEDGFWRNGAESLDNNPNSAGEGTPIVQDTEKVLGDLTQAENSTANHERVAMKEKTDITRQLSINKPTDEKQDNVVSGELKEGHTEVKVQGSDGENAERLDDTINQPTEIHTDKDTELRQDEMARCVQEKLALALQYPTECVWSEPELSETSETSKSEEWQEIEEATNCLTQRGMSIDETGQLSLLKCNDPVYADTASVTGWKDGDGVEMVTSVQQTKPNVCNHTNPHHVQTTECLLETNSQGPKDVIAGSSTNFLQEGCEPGRSSGIRSDTNGKEDIEGETAPSQNIQGSAETDQHRCLKTPTEMFASPIGAIEPKEGEDKQMLPSNQSNFQLLDTLVCINDTDREHHQPVSYKMEAGDGHAPARDATSKDEDKSSGTEQLLANLTSGNKEEDETTLIVSPLGQQAAGTLRKQVNPSPIHTFTREQKGAFVPAAAAVCKCKRR